MACSKLGSRAVIEQGAPPNAELDELRSFLTWLRLFVAHTSNHARPLVLILNAHLHYFFFQNVKAGSESLLAEVKSLCARENVRMLFYPLESGADLFNRGLFEAFKHGWSETMTSLAGQCGAHGNVHTHTVFVRTCFQALRVMFRESFVGGQAVQDAAYVNDLMRDCFAEMFRLYTVSDELLEKCGLDSCLKLRSEAIKVQQHIKDEYIDDEEHSEVVAVKPSNVSVLGSCISTNNNNTNGSSATLRNLSAAEVADFVAWIDGMSEMGSLCIKFTFLKELYVRQRSHLSSAGCGFKTKENFAHEKHWLLFIKKNRDSFKYGFSCGLNENDYLLRWLV